MSRPRGTTEPSPKRRPGAQNTAGSIRIISGRFRGRKLAFGVDPRTRPMKDRVREALFNLVSHEIAGRHALDLFAGTGALGLEALSRGASRATFWERHAPAAEALRCTLAEWGLREQAVTIRHDTLAWFRDAVPLRSEGGWLVFCSPPYEMYVAEMQRLLDTLSTIVDMAPREITMAVEADERFDMDSLPAELVWDVRHYPPTHLAIGRRG